MSSLGSNELGIKFRNWGLQEFEGGDVAIVQSFKGLVIMLILSVITGGVEGLVLSYLFSGGSAIYPCSRFGSCSALDRCLDLRLPPFPESQAPLIQYRAFLRAR